jgi:hypothetical protein
VARGICVVFSHFCFPSFDAVLNIFSNKCVKFDIRKRQTRKEVYRNGIISEKQSEKRKRKQCRRAAEENINGDRGIQSFYVKSVLRI